MEPNKLRVCRVSALGLWPFGLCLVSRPIWWICVSSKIEYCHQAREKLWK